VRVGFYTTGILAQLQVSRSVRPAAGDVAPKGWLRTRIPRFGIHVDTALDYGHFACENPSNSLI